MHYLTTTLYLSTLLITVKIAASSQSRPLALAALLLRASPERNDAKRAPSSAFMGLRGKKWEDEGFVIENESDQIYKRAMSRFLGLRGKKENALASYEKKMGPSGFVGLRGKKKITYPFHRSVQGEYSGKRAPVAFMGLRGKKSMLDEKRVPSGFYGLRG